MPLVLEELISNRGKVKINASINYLNSDQRGVSTAPPIVVQAGPNSYVYVQRQIGDRIENSDSFVGTLGVRYGLTSNTEIYLRGSGYTTRRRGFDVNGSRDDKASSFTSAWVGASYQFKKDDSTPALIGTIEVPISEKHLYSSSSFKSVTVGGTAYKSLDPIVLMASSGIRLSGTRNDGAERFKPGTFIYMSPSVGFAVNDRVTLITGVQWARQGADKRDGWDQSFDQTVTSLLLGVGFGIDKENTLNTTLKMNASRGGGADFQLSWQRKL